MKILNFWKKKHTRKNKRHVYKLRKQVAERRLRIGGRFVTKPQALEILGMNYQDLLCNEMIQELLTKHNKQ